MRRKLRFASGDASIVMDDTVGKLVRAALGGNHAVKAIEEHLDKVEGVLRDQWPVASGSSRSGFETGLKVSETRVVGYISNRVSYVYFVRSRATGGRPAWNTLLRTAVLPLNSELVARAARRWRDAGEV